MKTLVLSRKDLEEVASMADAVTAVETAFAAHERREATMPPKVYLDIPDQDGDFRAMPARYEDAAGVKWVNSHPYNPQRHGLPCVMGLYVLSDPKTAFPLAILDGTFLTALRTGAAAGVASKHLTFPPKRIGFIGSGVQARFLLDAHRAVFGDDLEVRCADVDEAAAKRFADEVGGEVTTAEAACDADVICTSTPSRTPVVRLPWLRQGAHINAMGADAPGKQELDVGILREATIYIDEMHQAAGSGEINVALRDGVLKESDIAGTIGEVIVGKLEVPKHALTVFDSTGLAIQDVVVAKMLYDAARAAGIGAEHDILGV